MYKVNDIKLEVYGITAGRVPGESIAVKGCFDMPKRIGDISHSWDDEDGDQPFINPGELFFAGRTITFVGIMLGTSAEIKTNLEAFKTAISAFVNTVPFETNYGTFCVYVKEIKTKSYNGGAIVTIEFHEPVVGAVCGINTEVTVYESAEYSATGVRNNCDEGFYGSEVTLTAPAGAFNSTISQVAANQLAVDWVLENLQTYANVNGTCIVNPTVYYNVRLEASFTRNNCAPGYQGSTVSYVVPAYTYSSLISQEDADAQAQAELDANLTQEIANQTGTCTLVYWNEVVSGQVQKNDCFTNFIGQVLTFTIPANTYSSTLSQAHANALAQAAWNQQEQQWANENLACTTNGSEDFKIAGRTDVSSFRTVRLQLISSFDFATNYVIKFRKTNQPSVQFNLVLQADAGLTAEQVRTMFLVLFTLETDAQWNARAGEQMYTSSARYPEIVSTNATSFTVRMGSTWNITEVWIST